MDTLARTSRQLAQILRAHRKSRDLTQQEAGTKVGLLPKTISGLETRPDGATIESLFRLLSALDLEMVLRDKAQSRRDAGKDNW